MSSHFTSSEQRFVLAQDDPEVALGGEVVRLGRAVERLDRGVRVVAPAAEQEPEDLCGADLAPVRGRPRRGAVGRRGLLARAIRGGLTALATVAAASTPARTTASVSLGISRRTRWSICSSSGGSTRPARPSQRRRRLGPGARSS
jgi:hypothetical protein